MDWVNAISTLVSSIVGGVIAFFIARMSIQKSREDKLVEDIQPFLWELKCQFEKIESVYKLFDAIHSESVQAKDIVNRYLQILSDDENKVTGCKSKWHDIQGKFFAHSYDKKERMATEYDTINELTCHINKFSRIQSSSNLKQILENDIHSINKFVLEHNKIRKCLTRLPKEPLYIPCFSAWM